MWDALKAVEEVRGELSRVVNDGKIAAEAIKKAQR